MDYKTTYETTDWELEARRVARAFDLGQEYLFRERYIRDRFDKPPVIEFYREMRGKDGKHPTIPELEGSVFICVYQNNAWRGRLYQLQPSVGAEATRIEIDWHGGLLSWVTDPHSSLLVARGLFNLGLLTPEFEAALKVTITAHEKLEWAGEYEERYGL